MKPKIIKKEKKGFALLFSILVSSLLLSIGLSIFNIALKELAISTATSRSIHSFYAADSGREAVMYEDIIRGTINIDRDNNICFKQEFSDSSDCLIEVTKKSNLGEDGGPNYEVTLKKDWDGNKTKIITTLTSRGYDTVGGDRLERAIQQTY